MKRCLQCGNVFTNDYLSCPKCGGMAQVIDDFRGEENFNNFGNNTYNFNTNLSGKGKRYISWYESTWFIVLGFLFCLPVGIAGLCLRLSNNSTYKAALRANPNLAQDGTYRMPKRRKGVDTRLMVIGIALMILWIVPAGIISHDIAALFSIIMMMTGIVCIICSIAKGGSNKRWEKYESLIDNRGNTKISFIAQKTGEKYQSVATYIQKMINKGYLDDPSNGISAYINGQYGLIVMTRNGRPIVSVEETMASDIKAAEEKRRAEEEAARRSGPMSIEDKFLFIVRDTINITVDSDAAEYLKQMENSVISITKLLNENPEEVEWASVKNMRNIYLPKTIELMDKYQKSTTSDDTKLQIKGMFSTISKALSNIENHLKNRNDFDTEIDIDVLKQTLERDGVLGSNFDL